MTGERNLETLIKSMSPKLCEGVYVFCSMAADPSPDIAAKSRFLFREEEAITLVMLRDEAIEHDIPFQYPSRMITLTIHSSLEAVGFLAAITTVLAEKGISVNAVSAFYHDHLFVPEDRADDAMTALCLLTTSL